MAIDRERGFSLIEVLIASAIVASAFGILGHLAVMATRANVAASQTSRASMLAAARADVLASELAVLAAPPPFAPADALTVNRPGFVDFFDAAGSPLGAELPVPDGAVLARRWSVRPLPGGPSGLLIVRVVVLQWPRAATLDAANVHRAELARVVSLRRSP